MKFFHVKVTLPHSALAFLKHARHPLPKVLLHFGGFIFYDVNSNY